MNPSRWLEIPRLLLRQLKWQLTLTYILVSFTAIFIASWWAIIAIAIDLGQTYPDLSWQEAISTLMLPVLGDILSSAPLLLLPAILISAYFGFLSARWLDARLSNLRQATTAWRKGDFSVKVQDEAADEIGRFGAELNQMAAELHALLQTRQELATLEERNRLARDLHDSVKQHLTAASLQVAAAQALLGQNPAAAAASLEQAGSLTHLAQQELGTIIFELQPVSLRQHGLVEALHQYVASWSQQVGIAADLEVGDGVGERPLSSQIESDLFRFAQEALSNVARHSQADTVHLLLGCDDTQLHFAIHDNGQGFDPPTPVGPTPVGHTPPDTGRGLHNLHQRMAALGGETAVSSTPGQGTTITAYLPLAKDWSE